MSQRDQVRFAISFFVLIALSCTPVPALEPAVGAESLAADSRAQVVGGGVLLSAVPTAFTTATEVEGVLGVFVRGGIYFYSLSAPWV